MEYHLPLLKMSAQQLKAFWEAVEGDTSLQEKLSGSTDGEIDTPIEAAAVVAIANEAGFTITAGDLLKADAQAILELNDEDLEKVAGGIYREGERPPTCIIPNYNRKTGEYIGNKAVQCNEL